MVCLFSHLSWLKYKKEAYSKAQKNIVGLLKMWCYLKVGKESDRVETRERIEVVKKSAVKLLNDKCLYKLETNSRI